MNRIVLYFSLFTFAMVSFSCEKSNPVENAKPTLTASENPVMIAVGVQWSKNITITGGSGGYFVKSNSLILLVSIG